jgi:hypothetical protein
MPYKHVKTCPIPSEIRKIQLKITIKLITYPTNGPKFRNLIKPSIVKTMV